MTAVRIRSRPAVGHIIRYMTNGGTHWIFGCQSKYLHTHTDLHVNTLNTSQAYNNHNPYRQIQYNW